LKFLFSVHLDINLTGRQPMKHIFFLFSEKFTVEVSTVSAAQRN